MIKSSIKRFFTVTDSSSTKDNNPEKKQKSISASLETQFRLSSSDDIITGNDTTQILDIIGWPPMNEMEISWKEKLSPEFQKPYFKRLLTFLKGERDSNKTVYPPTNEVFTALNLCPYDTIKVVIIGQDPYHGPDQAHGLAFSVRKAITIPPSLKNMIQEAKNDPLIKIEEPKHGNLECWSKQGVLLLNTVLTVRKGEANSHQKKGWEEFTDAVVRELGKKKGLVYLLWGKPAQAKCKGIDGKSNVIITSSHPSPLSAYKTDEAFIGSRCFSRCNEALTAAGHDPIDWNIV